MKTVETGVLCAVCEEGRVIAEIENVTDTPVELIPIGPGSRSYYHSSVTSIHCEKCGVQYKFPPGKPEGVSEILREIREEGEREETDERFSVIEKLFDRQEPSTGL